MRNLARVFVVVGVALALTLGVFSIFSEVQAKPPGGGKGPCICPMIYAPVLCDNGKIYSNQCVADCRNAKNCVPIGPGPIPF